MTSLQELARELSRRRTLGQTQDLDRDIKSAYVECLLLHLYDKVPTMDDLKQDRSKLTFLPEDEQGRTVRVVPWGSFPYRIYDSWIPKADVFVFARTGRQPYDAEIIGWLPRKEVEEAPRVEFPSKFGDGTAEAYVVTAADYLVKMPASFDFTDPCPHFDRWGGIWDDTLSAWDCFGCGRFIHDRHARELVEADQPG